MKVLLQNNVRVPFTWLHVTCIAMLLFFTGCHKGPEDPTLNITTVASGLVFPMGIETDKYGNIWVAEPGTANNDGKVIVIKPNGTKYDAIVNLSSIINEHSGELQGVGHLLVDKGVLYVLAGNFLYKANVSGFKPGDAPLDAASIPYEDVGKFVHSYPFVNDADDTHPYNLTKGPDGDLYITDAGANAILHRTGVDTYTVLAEIPGLTNPTPVGPPQIQSVPTAIVYDGHDFLVTTLTGFPFLPGVSTVYKVSTSGAVSVYQQGFTTLVDIAQGDHYGHLVVQFGVFGQMGFAPNTGELIWANGTDAKQLTGGLNTPVSIKQVNGHTWYVVSQGDGTVLKVSYN